MSAHPWASQRISSFGETVFATFTRLALENNAVNLGQGFPDFDPPKLIMDAYRAAADEYQQYPPLPGLPALAKTVAEIKSKLTGEVLEPVANVQITVGATEGLFAITQAFVNPGDEVVLLEPFYDAYPADVIMAGGIPVYVPMHPQANGEWLIDFDELRAAFSNKTKAIIINSPNNPTGKVFSAEELDKIIALATEFDTLIVSDEAYEYIAFTPFVSASSRPGGFERTLTVASIGKTFSVTGWKIGYVVGPAELVKAVRMAHQWIPFTVATPLQLASAVALKQAHQPGDSYFADLAQQFQNKRDILLQGLKDTPFKPLVPKGSYFIVADSSELGYKDDLELCYDLPKRIGVVAIPPSAFYAPEHKHLAKHLVRFAFCKTDEALHEASQRFKNL
ncbi:MAG: aminotransferase class I/II-fold pyridoxal phosphate-dependent enzyme [Trueperaceae bacterium]|nr:aminotransferase class I/II-fold pyridoxal phosphate-dependent enzyme [Trueperaceae bacterium]